MDPNEEFSKWQRNRTPQSMQAVVSSLRPDIDRSIMSAGGQPSPLTRGLAKRVVVDAMSSYNPKSGAKFRSWVQTQMQRLQRDVRNTRTTIRVPDTRAREAIRVRNAIAEVEAETGFEPSDSMLADSLGLSQKRIAAVRKSTSPEVVSDEIEAVSSEVGNEKLIMDMVYHSLPDRDQVIMEYIFGYNNVKPIQATEVARRLKISPAAVSQRLSKIRQMMEDARVAV